MPHLYHIAPNLSSLMPNHQTLLKVSHHEHALGLYTGCKEIFRIIFVNFQYVFIGQPWLISSQEQLCSDNITRQGNKWNTWGTPSGLMIYIIICMLHQSRYQKIWPQQQALRNPLFKEPDPFNLIPHKGRQGPVDGRHPGSNIPLLLVMVGLGKKGRLCICAIHFKLHNLETQNLKTPPCYNNAPS